MTKNLRTVFSIILLSVYVISFSGCQTDTYNDDIEQEKYILLNFTKAETRASISDDGSGYFSEGDRIGLYLDNGSKIQYRELRFVNGDWQPRLKRQDFGSGRLTISAHYPVIEGVSENAESQYEFKIALD